MKSKFVDMNGSGHFMTRNQIDSVNSTRNDKMSNETEDLSKRKDIYAQMPLRALGYSNELGEAIRPLCPLLANLSWLPAIGYISADIADKYRQDEYGEKDPSKGRATKQLATQLLASVLLPTIAVKAGQFIVDNAASAKNGLSLGRREKISDMILNSIDSGEHKSYLTDDGKIDKTAYKEALSVKIDEIAKHNKTHKKMLKPFYSTVDFLKKTFMKEPKPEMIKEYTSKVADRLLDARQNLLDGIKPESMSPKAYKKFAECSKNVPASEKQSMAFNVVKKLEKNRMFGNKTLKSIGGLTALALLAKPIDKFIETVVMDKFVGPAIDSVKKPNKNQSAE